MRPQGLVQELVVFDDRDLLLLDFLRSNAGRAYTVRFLCGKFGYSGGGSGSQLRKKLNAFLGAGYPVRRLDKGVMWCLQGRQLQHYATTLRQRARSIDALADMAERAGQKITEREWI